MIEYTGDTLKRGPGPDSSAVASFERYADHLPSAFAVTRGPNHILSYVNGAFRSFIGSNGDQLLGRPIADLPAFQRTSGIGALLDRAYQTANIARDRPIRPIDDTALRWICTAWPVVNAQGESEHLVIELRLATQGELTLGLQRDVAERLLLSALREQDVADTAEVSRRAAAFLAAESRRLAESLDESATLTAMAGMSLPHLGAWCIVDTLDGADKMHRLAMIHPDPEKQALLDSLEGRWIPAAGDGFGLPAALRSPRATLVTEDVDAALAASAHDPEVLAVLRELGVSTLLTVPLVVRNRLVGAVTYVGGRNDAPFTPEDLELAEDLASRSAMALDRARLYGEAIELKAIAESASQTKTAFLGMMSHELRTPLNAIGGYVDLMDMEIHGPVTEEQHADLARIRTNQRYLTGLISDLLNFTKVGSGRVTYAVRDVLARDVLVASVGLVDALIDQRHLVFDGVKCDPDIMLVGDRERLVQILVNLLSNAIKFTPSGGRIDVECEVVGAGVLIHVADSGIGIAPDHFESIFDPFVQVKGQSPGPEAGIGLGLAISRGLARGMQGDLTVESTLGKGTRFTVTLPRSSGHPTEGTG